MANNAPGKHYRKGITLIEAVQKFGDDAAAEAWFVERRWPDGIQCVQCGSEHIHTRKPDPKRKTPVYHCNDCKKDFTVKTGYDHARFPPVLEQVGNGILPIQHQP